MSSSPRVFISYSHKDVRWLERLQTMLKPAARSRDIDPWDDMRIRSGQNWREEIGRAIAAANAAVALVSPEFLGSDFIAAEELPPLLEAAKAEGRTIVWLLLTPCLWKHTVFGTLQAAHDTKRPLNSLKKSQADDVLAKVAEELLTILRAKPPAQASPAIPNAAKARLVFLVPYTRNPYFTGRMAELQRLRDELTSANDAGPLVVNGRAGIGKTQLVVEYAYRYRTEYDAVFWVSGQARSVADSSSSTGTEQQLASGYGAIAQALNLPEAVVQDQDSIREAVRSWLERNRRWLLIVDNVDDGNVLKRYLPRTVTGHVLLTSRLSSASLNVGRGVEVSALDVEEATNLLLSRRTESGDTAPVEVAAARALAVELEGLPLTLEQASAYVANTSASFQDYLQNVSGGFSSGANSSDLVNLPERLSKTLALGLAQLEGTPESADLLGVSSYLAPDAIPLDLLASAAASLGPVLGARLAGGSADRLALEAVIEPLHRFSLVRRRPGTYDFAVHRLVQRAVRDGLKSDEKQTWTRRAVSAIERLFPSLEEIDAVGEVWARCDRLATHATAATEWALLFGFQTATVADLLDRVGYYLSRRGHYQAALKTLTEALRVCQAAEEVEFSLLARLQNDLGYLHIHLQDFERSEILFTKAHATCCERGEELVLLRALVETNLGYLYLRSHKLDSATRFIESALSVRRRLLPPDSPDTWTTLNLRARAYKEAGSNAEAEQLYLEVLAARRRTRAPEHPEIATTLNGLATLYTQMGEATKAEPLFREALAIRAKVLGENHPDTMSTTQKLARLIKR